jgi:hypothetical protein
LQEISDKDATAEGMGAVSCHAMGFEGGFSAFRKQFGDMKHRTIFRQLWGKINGPESWDANPWVWVVEFKLITPET